MKIPFTEYHLLRALELYQIKKLPLDQFLNLYFRNHKSLGSKDRAFIAESIYEMIRWLSLIDFHLAPPFSWAQRYQIYQSGQWKKKNLKAPAHVLAGFPKNLYEAIKKNYSILTTEICLASNQQAPITVRANPLKITRDALMARWSDFDISLTQHSPFGIQFNKRCALFALAEFKEGYFEMQDEGSQLLALKIKAKPGDQILDFCSGSGGKSLAFAHLTQGKGQIYLHDVRMTALIQAKKRLKRAGIHNAQFVLSTDKSLEKLKKNMDWVLVDAPCSGTGTLRRNPDMKWDFNLEKVKKITSEQRVIFEKALSYLKPNGKIVYATCSLLHEENEEQVKHFLKTYPIELDDELFKTLPGQSGMDGFFAATFKRKN